MDNPIITKSECSDCGGVKFIYNIRLVGTNWKAREVGIKFVPMVGKYCVQCGHWITWAPQTPELIEKLNHQLKDLKWRLL